MARLWLTLMLVSYVASHLSIIFAEKKPMYTYVARPKPSIVSPVRDDGWTDGWTDRQTDDVITIEHPNFSMQGPNILDRGPID